MIIRYMYYPTGLPPYPMRVLWAPPVSQTAFQPQHNSWNEHPAAFPYGLPWQSLAYRVSHTFMEFPTPTPPAAIPSLEQLMHASLQTIWSGAVSESPNPQTKHPHTPSTQLPIKRKIEQIITKFQEEDEPALLEAAKQQSVEEMKWTKLAQDTLGGKYPKEVCKKRYVEIIQRSLHSPSKEGWSADEDRKLKIAARQYRLKWNLIAVVAFQGIRTSDDCQERWKQLPKRRRKKTVICSFNNYDTQDDSALKAAAAKQTLDRFSWQRLARDTLYKKYTFQVCRKRLLQIYEALNPLSTEAWSAEEDAILQGAKKCHKNFKDIAGLYFKGTRSASDCKMRWLNHATRL